MTETREAGPKLIVSHEPPKTPEELTEAFMLANPEGSEAEAVQFSLAP